MLHHLLITIDMNMDAVEYLKKVPGAGARMVNKIISEIDSDKRIKLMQYQVLIVLGKTCEESNHTSVTSLFNWSIFWKYRYLSTGERPKVTKVMDKAINKIITLATRDLLWSFYTRDSPF